MNTTDARSDDRRRPQRPSRELDILGARPEPKATPAGPQSLTDLLWPAYRILAGLDGEGPMQAQGQIPQNG